MLAFYFYFYFYLDLDLDLDIYLDFDYYYSASIIMIVAAIIEESYPAQHKQIFVVFFSFVRSFRFVSFCGRSFFFV